MIKLILKGLLILVGVFFVISHLWFSIVAFLSIALLVFVYNKGKDKDETLRKIEKNYFNHINYIPIRTRKLFHKSLTSLDFVGHKGAYILADKDDLGRIVGGFMVFDGHLLDTQNKAIKVGFYKRSDDVRKNADVPGFDTVKQEWAIVQGKERPLYHRTHLVPYRLCLNDGEYKHVMFTGTARLNSGMRVKENYLPTEEDHNRNAEVIFKNALKNSMYYMNPKRTSQFSLDDFERSISHFVHQSAQVYKHTYRYGVECFYDDNTLIPSYVEVTLVDCTDYKVLMRATLLNII
jgi:hypothetical protein